jgi:hypothetical protein
MKSKLLFLVSLHYLLILLSGCCPEPETNYVVPNELIIYDRQSTDEIYFDCALKGETVLSVPLASINYKKTYATQKCRQNEVIIVGEIVDVIIKSSKAYNDSLPAGADLKDIFEFAWPQMYAMAFPEFINSYNPNVLDVRSGELHIFSCSTVHQPHYDSIHNFTVSIVFRSGDILTNQVYDVEF